MTTNGQDRLQYRTAKPEDIAVLLPLIRAAYRGQGEDGGAGWTTEADILNDDRIDEKGLLAKINDPKGVILMVFDDSNKLISCCELVQRSEESNHAYFGLFAVDPKKQGGGLGKKVLAYSEDYVARNWGTRTLEMQVIWTRDDIIAWYERRGYTRTGQTRPFPYAELVNGKALRDDLHFEVMVKEVGRNDA